MVKKLIPVLFFIFIILAFSPETGFASGGTDGMCDLSNEPGSSGPYNYVELTKNADAGITEGSGEYGYLDTVTITAVPYDHYTFKNWEVIEGDVVLTDASNPATTFVMPDTAVVIEAIYESSSADFKYTVKDGKATITGYNGPGGLVIIPETLGGYCVNTIGGSAFLSNAGITSVIITEPILSIENSAFYGCTNIRYISIPDSVESIGTMCFYGCIEMKTITMGQNVESIGSGAFYGCSNLNEILIPNNMRSLCEYLFKGCDRLRSVTLGSRIQSIDDNAFEGCHALENIFVSEDNLYFRSIDGVLYDKTAETLVKYPAGRIGEYSILDGVKSIQTNAFNYCTLLTDIYIPETIEDIGEYAFCCCRSLSSVTLPDTLTVINEGAFWGCTNLSNITMGRYVDSIGESAFINCTALTQIDIPGYVTKVGNKAFFQCWDLESIYFWGEKPDFGTSVFTSCSKAYYHISFAGTWSSFSNCAKQMFCLLTLDLKDGQDPDTYIAPLNNFKLTSLDVPERKNYTFEAWYIDEGYNCPWNLNTTVTNDITLYAKWVPEKYTVKFETGSGDAIDPQTEAFGSNIIKAPEAKRANYSFEGWYPTSACNTAAIKFPYTVTGSVTLYAKWRPKDFDIIYNLDGGKATYENPVTYTVESSSIELHNPAKTGYTFEGWTGTDVPELSKNVTIPRGSSGNRSYLAHWKANEYNVTFNAREGSIIPDVTAAYNSKIPEPAVPVKQGYNFAGWYKESSCVNKWDFQADRVTGNETLYAKWQPLSCMLEDIRLSAGMLMKRFVKSTLKYDITLGEYEESITLTPVKEYDGAVMKINNVLRDSLTVKVGNGKSVTVKVAVSFNKKTKNYTFRITRLKSSNNDLCSLSASAGSFDRPFDPNVLNYTISLDENTKKVTIKAIPLSAAARVSPSVKSISLNNGDTKTAVFSVKAQSGAKKTYTVTVIRAKAVNTFLKTLNTSPGLLPGFNPETTNYTIMLPAGKDTAVISAKPAGYKAEVYIDGEKKSSEKVTALSGQSVTVRVTVVAQAGNTKDYYITFIS